MDQERIIAVGLLTRRDLDLLGPTFSRAWPVEEFHSGDPATASDEDAQAFADLLRAIDEAEGSHNARAEGGGDDSRQ